MTDTPVAPAAARPPIRSAVRRPSSATSSCPLSTRSTASRAPSPRASRKAFRRTRSSTPGSTGSRTCRARRDVSSSWRRWRRSMRRGWRAWRCTMARRRRCRSRRSPATAASTIPAGARRPIAISQQAFLAQEAWWREATKLVRGMQPKDAARVAFMARQLLDAVSPSNVPWLNPLIVERTLDERGANLARGCDNLWEDLAARRHDDAGADAAGLRTRQGHRGHARRGRLPQRSDRAHPIHAGDAERRRRAGADRAGLDHEILRARPAARTIRWCAIWSSAASPYS